MSYTQLPAARAPIVDPTSGLPTPAFYRFLLAFFNQAGNGVIGDPELETMLFSGIFNPRKDDPSPDLSGYVSRPGLPSAFGLADVFDMLTTIQSYAAEIDALKRRVANLENLSAVANVANY